MHIRLFARPVLRAFLLLSILCLPAQAAAEEEAFFFSDSASSGRPLLRIAYVAGTKGELYPCPT